MKKLSASRMGLYCDCSLAYKFHYVDKLYKPSVSVHFAYGTAIHKGIEVMNQSLATEKMPLEDMLQAFHDCYYEELKKMDLEDNYFKFQLYEMGINSLEKFYNEFVDYEVIGTEIPFTVPIDGSDTHSVTGFIDAIIKRKSQLTIVDYKTSKEAFPKFKIDTSLQLAIYAYAFRKLLSDGTFELRKKQEDYIAYYVLVKDYENYTGQIKMQRKKIGEKEINRVLYVCNKIIEAEKHEIYVPNFNSACKYCDYKKECLGFSG